MLVALPVQGAVTACMIGSSIAIRYSAQRPQFGDKLIMDYLSHQRRLLPGLAATYALHLGLKQLKVGCCGAVGVRCGGCHGQDAVKRALAVLLGTSRVVCADG